MKYKYKLISVSKKSFSSYILHQFYYFNKLTGKSKANHPPETKQTTTKNEKKN